VAVIDSAQPARISPLRRMFYGPMGLRAGWRVLAFIIPMVFFEVEGGRLIKVQHDLFGQGDTAAGWLFLKTILFVWVLVVVLIIGAFEHRTLAEYGLPLQKMFGKNFWAGALFGFGLLTTNIALTALTGAYSFGTVALPWIQIVKHGLLWAAADLMVGIAEEFVFRGYLLFTLTRGLGFWPAAVLTSVLFGLTHLDVPGEPWTAITNITLLSLLLCLALRRTGNLWFAIGSHMAFDWGQAFSTRPTSRRCKAIFSMPLCTAANGSPAAMPDPRATFSMCFWSPWESCCFPRFTHA
jgi:membrane protease YdiL (CAAX protease family)